MSGSYRRWARALAFVAIGLGLAILVETAGQGGGSVGYVLGVLFIGLGIGRLYLMRRR